MRAAAAWLAVLALVPFLPRWLAGDTLYWGDLIYVHHPWRALAAQMIQAGEVPAWNPYLYSGMPLAAQMQSSVFYPGSLLFSVFDFPTGLALYQALHLWLAGWLCFLWLRRGFAAAPALGGAAAVALGGFLVSRAGFVNHLAVLALAPGILLFFRSPAGLALTLALCFFAGYPPILLGSAAGAWALRLLLGSRPLAGAAAWAAAVPLALALSGALLAPAAELTALSRRSAGMGLEETLSFGLSPADLLGWASPLLAAGPLRLDVEWWKAGHWGFVACAAAAWGLACLRARARRGAALYLGGAIVLVLGGSNPVSRALWEHLAPLRFVRYPGNMTYLIWPAAALLVSAGLARTSRPLLAAAALSAELALCASTAFRWADRGVFSHKGPLVGFLQSNLGDDRYLLSPRALESTSGWGVLDWKARLYGTTNAPFRLRAAGNFGEPLTPEPTYRFMDALYSAPGAEAAAALFPAAGIRFLLSPSPRSGAPRLERLEPALWEIHRLRERAARAVVYSEEAGQAIPASLVGPPPPGGRPARFASDRPDRFEVAGRSEAAGWVYVTEPLYPGWRATLLAAGRPADAARPAPALGAFQKVPVPAGAWRLVFQYDPASLRLGILASLAAAALLCGWSAAALDRGLVK